MKKITRYFVVLCMMLLLASGTVFAGQQGNVYDDGELLSETELSTLSESIDTFAEKSGWNVYALTTEDAGGKTSQAYADDFYDEMVPGTDGLALLIDMDNREITVSTSGIAIRYLTDELRTSLMRAMSMSVMETITAALMRCLRRFPIITMQELKTDSIIMMWRQGRYQDIIP